MSLPDRTSQSDPRPDPLDSGGVDPGTRGRGTGVTTGLQDDRGGCPEVGAEVPEDRGTLRLIVDRGFQDSRDRSLGTGPKGRRRPDTIVQEGT